MGATVFPRGEVIERLKAVGEIKLVAIAPDLNAALNTPPRVTPAVFAVFGTVGRPPKFSGPPIQQDRVTTLTLIVWVSHHGDAAATCAVMDNVLRAIDLRFAGWSPQNPAFGELVFQAARDEFSHGQYLVNQVNYACDWNFSASRQP